MARIVAVIKRNQWRLIRCTAKKLAKEWLVELCAVTPLRRPRSACCKGSGRILNNNFKLALLAVQ
jgi:hypothetical protein